MNIFAPIERMTEIEAARNAEHISPEKIRCYTAFNPQNVLNANPKRLLEIAAALGMDNLQHDLVCFTPERNALEWTIIGTRIGVYSHFGDDIHFKNTVDTIYNKFVVPAMQSEADHFAQKRREIERFATNIVTQFRNGKHILRADAPEDEKEAYAIWKLINDRYESGQYQPGALLKGITLDEVIACRIFDKLFNNYVIKATSTIVQAAIQKAIAQGAVEPLIGGDGFEKIIVYGGGATGKSSIIRYFADALINNKGCTPHNMAILSKDNYCPLLFSNWEEVGDTYPNDLGYMARLEFQKLNWMSDILVQEAIKKGKCPVLFLERNPREVLPYLQDQEIDFYMLTVPPEIAVQRNIDRAKLGAGRDNIRANRNRVSSAEDILRFHKFTALDAPKLIIENIGSKIRFHIMDNNVPYGEPPKKIAFCDSASREMTIYDVPGMLAYSKTSKLNQKATSYDDLFEEGAGTLAENAGDILALSNHIKINFSDKNGRIYAFSEPAEGANDRNVTIINKTILQSLDKESQSVIRSLDMHPRFLATSLYRKDSTDVGRLLTFILLICSSLQI